jgi:hypothetical protein
MKRGLIVIVSIVVLVGAAVALAQTFLTEQPVFVTARNERNPAADHNPTTEVWALTQSRAGNPNKYDAFVKEGSDPLVKLNATGQGWTGGIDYPFVAYQQISGGQSDLYFFNISTSERTPAYDVNSPQWEWHPTFQGAPNDYEMLFNRDALNSPTQRVIYLHHADPSVHDGRILSTITKATHFLQSDQINGNWVTYTRCAPNCNVRLYDIGAQTTTTMPKPVTTSPRQQYAGAVTSTGAVYLVRSGPKCGQQVRIVRYDPAVPDPQLGTIVAVIAQGYDIAISHARENPGGSVDVFYDRVNCSTGKFNIIKVTDPPPGP